MKQSSNLSKAKQTSSTKNKESENSIFSVIERAKAKSNGTTPQNAVQPSPQAGCGSEQTPNSKKSPIRATQLTPLSDEFSFANIQTGVQSSGPTKAFREFVSPTSVDQASPNTLQYIHKKKPSKNGFSFISSIFGNKNPQSPARMNLAKKFLQEKLGQEKFTMIDKLHQQNPKSYLTGVKEFLGPEMRHVLPVIEYVYGKDNNFGFKSSPISGSANTYSTTYDQTEPASQKVDPNDLTFGIDSDIKIKNS